VRHDDDRSVEDLDGLDEGVDGLHVQVVRGLIEQQQVGGRDEKLAEQHSALLAAGEHAHLLRALSPSNIMTPQMARAMPWLCSGWACMISSSAVLAGLSRAMFVWPK